MKCFSIRLWHVTKSGFYTTGNDQLSSWTKKKLWSTFQGQPCTEKRSWSLFAGLLPVWSTTAFWVPSKPLHLRSMLSKLKRCTKNCNAQFSLTTMPNHTSYNQYFKSWTNWATKFCLIHHIHLTSHHLTTTSSSFSNDFLQRKCFCS